jgi:hypothetical protein
VTYPDGELGQRVKEMLYAAAALRELMDMGMVAGQPQCTLRGMSEADQLRATGYEPSDAVLVERFVELGVRKEEAAKVLLLWKNRDKIAAREA